MLYKPTYGRRILNMHSNYAVQLDMLSVDNFTTLTVVLHMVEYNFGKTKQKLTSSDSCYKLAWRVPEFGLRGT